MHVFFLPMFCYAGVLVEPVKRLIEGIIQWWSVMVYIITFLKIASQKTVLVQMIFPNLKNSLLSSLKSTAVKFCSELEN